MTFRIGPFIEVDTVHGEPWSITRRQLVPVARVLSVSLGRRGGAMAGGIVWARPIAVEVTEATGTRRLAIPSANMRFVLLMGAGLGLLGLLSIQAQLRRTRTG